MSDDSIKHSSGQDLYIGVDIGGTKIGVCIGNYEALIFREIRFPTKNPAKSSNRRYLKSNKISYFRISR